MPSRTGSIFQTYPGFIPDYTIKAVTDVLYLKIKRTTYLRAMKASLMGKKASHSGELNERELEHLLEKVRKFGSCFSTHEIGFCNIVLNLRKFEL